MSSQRDGRHVLESNQALRSWAAGLRTWSRSARVSAAAERLRTRRVLDQAIHAQAASDLRTGDRTDRPAAPVLPTLGDVHVDEMLAVLVQRHDFGAVAAVRALQLALLGAGYPADTDDVQASDALPILDSALRYPR
jgi:hypothetical protein